MISACSLIGCDNFRSGRTPAASVTPPTWPVADLSKILSTPRSDFYFWNRDLGIAPFTGANLVAASGLYSLGQTPLNGTGAIAPQVIGEWDWSGMEIPAGGSDGAGLPRSGYPCFNHNQGCADPATDYEAYTRLQSYFYARVAALPAGSPIVSFSGHSFLAHYQAEWGAGLIANEVGENIISTQAHVAFIRGAARQYIKPWGLNMSSWFGASVRDYSGTAIWTGSCAAGYPTCVSSTGSSGHSLSLTRRTYYLGYMGGANFMMDDNGSVSYFSGTTVPLALSPAGAVAQDLNVFANAHPLRGRPFVPFAILLDHYHGLGIESWISTPTTWATFGVDSSRQFTKDLLETIWPTAFDVSHTNEDGYMVPTPFGDTFDALLENTPTDLLKMYSVILATGRIANNPDLMTALKAWVANGGILVLDSTSYAQTYLNGIAGASPAVNLGSIDPASAVSYSVGRGQVILVKTSAAYAPVLNLLTSKVIPFQLNVSSTDGSKSGTLNIQYSLNKISDNHWVVTLANSNGITKTPTADEVADPTWTLNVDVTPAQGHVQNVSPWRGAGPASIPNGFRATVSPGEVSVFEFYVSP